MVMEHLVKKQDYLLKMGQYLIKLLQAIHIQQSSFFGDGYGQFQRYRILLTAYSGYTTMISTDDFITNYFARIYDLYFALLLMSQYKRKITYTIDNDLEDNVNELHHLSKPVELDEYQLIEHRYFAVEQQTQQNNQLLHLIT